MEGSTHVQLRPRDARDRPLDRVPAPHERARRVPARGRVLPRHLELRHGRVRARLDGRVQARAVGQELDELPVRDLELRSGGGVAEHRVRRRVRDLGPQVLVEVRVLLCSVCAYAPAGTVT